MNFLEKYKLNVTTRYGTGYVRVEDIGHVIHELEQDNEVLRVKLKAVEVQRDDLAKISYEAFEINKKQDGMLDELINIYSYSKSFNVNISIALLLISAALFVHAILPHLFE